jgi:hypothetical protein
MDEEVRDFLVSLAAALVIAGLLVGLVFGCEYYHTH